VVTGVGVVSAIGNNAEANLKSLQKGETGIGRAHHLHSKYTDTLLFGEVKLSNEQLLAAIRKSPGHALTRTELLAFLAFEEAIADAGIEERQFTQRHTALLSATTVSGMVEMEAIHADANFNTEPSPYIHSYRTGAHTLLMARTYGLKGYTDTMNTACSSSANAIMLGARLIKTGKARCAIVGGVDALSKYTVNGFNALQIFSDEITRPFDANRKGLNLGEGAAYLVLEREEDAKAKKVYGVVSGYGNANDAHHPSSMSPEATGVRLAISGALQTAGIQATEISYVNAHGTGTENNDFTEVRGMEIVFGKVPPFASTKSYTGHTLAAAGAVEAVYSLFSLKYQQMYPTLNWQIPMPETEVRPLTRLRSDLPVMHVLSNSFGFGGNCSSLIFSLP